MNSLKPGRINNVLEVLAQEVQVVLGATLRKLAGFPEAGLARASLQRMLDFEIEAHWTERYLFLEEAHTVRAQLKALVQLPEAREAQVAVQRVLDFVEVCEKHA